MPDIIDFINAIDDNIAVSFQKISNFIDGTYLFFIIVLIYVLIILFVAMIFGFNFLVVKGYQSYKKNEKLIMKYVKFAKI